MIRKHLSGWKADLGRMRTKGSFARNAAYAFSGTALITGSQLILPPFLARIYGPEVYGAYGIFSSLCMSLAVVADLGYTQAYLLTPREDRFLDLFRGHLLILAALFVLLLPVVALHERIYAWMPGWSGMGAWLWLLPLGMVVQFLPSMCTQWLVRMKAFGRSASIGGGTNLVLRLFNLGYGWLSQGAAHGLILGETLVRGAGIGVYWVALRPFSPGRVLRDWDLSRIRDAWKEFRNCPRYVFPERWVALLGLQLPIYLLSSDPVVVGQFSMASGLLLLPLRLFGFSLGVVFNQKAAETFHRDPADLARITRHFFYRLLATGVLPFAAITVLGDIVFQVVLGGEWRMAGVFAAWLGAFFFFRHLSEPIINLFNVHRRERQMLQFQAVLLGARAVVVSWAAFFHGSVLNAVLAYAVVSALGYVWLTGHLLRLAGVRAVKPLVHAVLVMGASVALLCLLRSTFAGTWFPMP